MEPQYTTRKKGKKLPKGESHFINIPWVVLRSPAYIGLSLGARALLVEFVLQYDGSNNGHLHASRTYLKKRGWVSNDTIKRQTDELLDSYLIEQTWTGGLNMGAHRFAVTWRPVSNFTNLDISSFRVGKWKEKNAKSRPAIGQGKPDCRAREGSFGKEASPANGPESTVFDKTACPTIGHNVDYLPQGTGFEVAINALENPERLPYSESQS